MPSPYGRSLPLEEINLVIASVGIARAITRKAGFAGYSASGEQRRRRSSPVPSELELTGSQQGFGLPLVGST